MCSWPWTFSVALWQPLQSTLGIYLGLYKSSKRWVCLIFAACVASSILLKMLSELHHSSVQGTNVPNAAAVSGSKMMMWCCWTGEALRRHVYMMCFSEILQIEMLIWMQPVSLDASCHMLYISQHSRCSLSLTNAAEKCLAPSRQPWLFSGRIMPRMVLPLRKLSWRPFAFHRHFHHSGLRHFFCGCENKSLLGEDWVHGWCWQCPPGRL